MKVLNWTIEQLRLDFPKAASLREILTAVEEKVENSGDVVCEISVNGLVLTEPDELRFSENPLSEVTTLQLRTQNPETLLDESLGGCRTYVEKILVAIEESALLFRSEAIHDAHNYYRQCIEGTQWFIEMVTHYKSAHQKVRGGRLSASWIELESAMILVLEQIFDAYKEKNYILVADLLEYDLITIFNRWQTELSQLERRKTSDSRHEGPSAVASAT